VGGEDVVRERGSLFIVAAAAAAILWPAQAPAAGPVALEVKIILASNDGQGVDPSLASLQDRLDKLKFNSYRLLSTLELILTPPKGGTVSLPNGQVLRVEAVQIQGDRVNMTVSVADLVKTGISLANRGTFMLGGINEERGELILAISASF
jgi:hypothetical protein